MYKTIGLALGIVLLSVTTSWADPYSPVMQSDTYGIQQGGGNILSVPTPSQAQAHENQIYQGINRLLGTSYQSNADVDFAQYRSSHSFWTNVGGPATFMFVNASSAYSNTLGVYNMNTPGTVQSLFTTQPGNTWYGDGTQSSPLPALINPATMQPGFGFTLTTPFDVWNSNPSLNANGFDHMVVYRLTGLDGKTIYINQNGVITQRTLYQPYLIAWEDLPFANGTLGDEDYNDLFFLVDEAAPVPEPLTLALMGSGLLGALGIRRKQRA